MNEGNHALEAVNPFLSLTPPIQSQSDNDSVDGTVTLSHTEARRYEIITESIH